MTKGAYYNENDPFAAEWLRALIFFGHIAPGDVDERSIEDVSADDLRGYAQHHFFAGIGVWSYALRQAGWPDDRPVWTGSCPCQPFSAAGKGGGFADERHLWPAWQWLVGQCRPDVILGEQVASKDGRAWFDLVSSDLEGLDYACGAFDTCAAGVGAPHIRQRLYWMAHRNSPRRSVERGLRLQRAEFHDTDRCGENGAMVNPEGQQARLSGRPWKPGRTGNRPLPVGSMGDESGHRQGCRGDCGLSPGCCGGSCCARPNECDGNKCVLADADGGHAGPERQQRSRQHGQQQEDGGALHLADALPAGRPEGRAIAGTGSPSSSSSLGGLAYTGPERRQQICRSSPSDEAEDGGTRRNESQPHSDHFASGGSENRSLGGLADDDDQRRVGRRSGVAGDGRAPSWIEPERFRDAGETTVVLGDNNKGLAVGPFATVEPGTLRIEGATLGETGLVRGFWRDADWIYCRDGKYRPVGPGTFPLVTGAPARVGRLRGYGNAINAEQAKVFIEAVQDVIHG